MTKRQSKESLQSSTTISSPLQFQKKKQPVQRKDRTCSPQYFDSTTGICHCTIHHPDNTEFTQEPSGSPRSNSPVSPSILQQEFSSLLNQARPDISVPRQVFKPPPRQDIRVPRQVFRPPLRPDNQVHPRASKTSSIKRTARSVIRRQITLTAAAVVRTANPNATRKSLLLSYYLPPAETK